MRRLDPRFWVVAALSLGPAVANSFARFAYALLLPAMRAELGLNYSQAGSLNTANALGYLAGALFTVGYVSHIGNRRLFSAGMVLTALSLIGSGVAEGFGPQVAMRAMSGFGGAMVFICGAVLASNIIRAARRIREPSNGAPNRPWQPGVFRAALGSYFLFGAGYIAYMTFVVAWMRSHGASALDVALTWGTLGIATMLAPLAWRVPRSRWYAGRTLAATGVILAIGAAVPLVSTALPAMILSALLFGGAMFTAPTSVTDLVKSSLPKSAWAPAVAIFTVVFAIGQAIGPVLSGWLADATDSLYAGLGGSVAVLLAASAVAMLQQADKRERAGLRPRRLASDL